MRISDWSSDVCSSDLAAAAECRRIDRGKLQRSCRALSLPGRFPKPAEAVLVGIARHLPPAGRRPQRLRCREGDVEVHAGQAPQPESADPAAMVAGELEPQGVAVELQIQHTGRQGPGKATEAGQEVDARSAERRGGKEWASTGETR